MREEPELELADLKLLRAIEDSGSMAKAAAMLDRAPSAVTWRIRRLEERLDLLLVDRRGSRARLTESARLLLQQSHALEQGLADALRLARRAALGYEAELTLAVDAIVPMDLLWPLVARFDHEPAPTQLRFWQEVLSGSWEALLSGRADLVIGAPGEAPAHPDIRTALLGAIEFVFCVAPSHPLAAEPEPLAPERIARHRAIAIGDSARSLPRRTAGLLPGQPVLTVPDFQYKIAAQAAGLGVGWLPRHLADPEIAAGRLHARRTAQGRVSAPIHLAWREPVRGRALAWFIPALTGLVWPR